MIKKYILSLLILVFFLTPRYSANAQFTAPADFEFWYGVPAWSSAIASGISLKSPQKLHLTNISNTDPAYYIIDMPADPTFIPITGTIPAGGSEIVDMTSFILDITVAPANSVVNKGLRIQVDGKMGAYYANEAVPNYGTMPLRGPNALGTSFIVPGQNMSNNNTGYAGAVALFAITATEDNTKVTITPSEAITGHGANVPFTITLNKGQSYSANAVASNKNHLGGSLINSTAPVVVTYSDDLLSTPGVTGTDNAGDQLIPISKFGLEYVQIRTNLNPAYPTLESSFIFGSQNGTTVTVFDGTTTTTLVVNKGEFVRYSLPAGINIANIKADKPVLVYQLGGAGGELGGGVLTPISACKGAKGISFQYPSAATTTYFNFVAPDTIIGNFILNGSSTVIQASDFLPIPGIPGWSYCRKNVTGRFTGNSVVNISNAGGKFYFYQNIATSGGGDFSNFSDFGNVVLFPKADHVCASTSIELKSGAIAFNTNIASYSWTGPNGFTSNISDPVISNTAENMGTYVVTVTDTEGCSYTENLVVDRPIDDITVSPTSSTRCMGSTIQFTSVAVPAEAVPVSISWTGPNGFTSTLANFTINNITTAQGGTYTCTYTDKYNCLITKSITITVDGTRTVPSFNITGNDKLSCGIPSVSLSTVSGYISGLNYETYNPYDATSLLASSDFNTITKGFYNQQPTNTGVASQMNLAGLTGITAASSTAYGVKYKGFINITTAGTYIFYTNSKDGSNLYIDGSLRVSNDGGHTATEVASTAFNLSAGYHTIEVNYFDGATGAGSLSVSYQRTSASPMGKTVIPTGILLHAGGAAPVGITYSWKDSNNVEVGTTSTLAVTAPGTYTLTGDNGLCNSTSSYLVKKIEDYDYSDMAAPWSIAQAKILSCVVAGVPSGNNGAVWAGSGVSIETAPLRNATATADTFDDGLTMSLVSGTTNTATIRLSSNTPGKTVYYGLWFDWNNTNGFADDGVSAFYSGSGTAGTAVSTTVTVPAGASPLFKTRLIISDVPVVFTGFDNIYANGEVEDYTNIQLSGTVFDDANGLTGPPANTVDGTGTNAGGLTAILVDGTGNVVANAGVATDGTYKFSFVAAGTYSVVLSTTAGIIGSAAPSPSLPPGWLNTGENLGVIAGNDGTVNGILPNIVVGTADVVNANFGIDTQPIANPVSSCQVDPGGSTKLSVPILTGSDFEDGTYNGSSSTNTIKIVTLPANGVLYYNNVATTAGQVITAYNPNLLTVDPNVGSESISFTFSEIDAAGKESLPATVTISTANAGPDRSVIFGPSATATMGAVGTGTWTPQGDNPGTATITNPTSPTTTITNFSVPGIYNFIWTNTNGCPDTAKVGTPLSVIIANDDAGSTINGLTGGTSLTNVLSNDTLNGLPATTATVDVSFKNSTNPGISLSGTDVVVAPGTPAGNYTLTYGICEVVNPTNCDEGMVTVTVISADLSVVKTVDNPTPTVGTNVTFTITATNNGPSPATGVSVADTLPSGYTFVSATPSTGTWVSPNWSIGNLANGASAALTVVATVNATGLYANTATITGTESDPIPGNNTSTITPTPVASTDLRVVKTVNNSSPTVGTNVTFTITATNNGPSNATGVKITDALPPGYTLVSATPSAGVWTAPNWTIGSLANGISETLMVVATVNASGSYANTATITGTESDPATANNTSTVTTTPVSSTDLSVVKTVSSNSPRVGTDVTFTITATNNGPSDATNVNVTDTLPTGYTFVSATPSAGTWIAPNWTIGSLANGVSETLTVVATVKASGIYDNTATITGTESDPAATNNTSTVTPTPVANTDLSVVKTVSSSSPRVGTDVTFTITATNNGPSNATNVNVADTLPSGYTFVSATPSTGTTWTAPNWIIGNLANATNVTLTIVATVNASGSYVNTATITGTESDPTLANNTSTVTPTPVASTDLSVVKTISSSSPRVGTDVTFTITATNNGPSNATNVNVADTLPSGYTFVSATPSAGTTWTAPNWIIGNLANATNATLTIVATVNASGSYVNTATITGTESDPTLANNTSTVTPTPMASTDLSVVKTISSTSPIVGTDVTFTITATNNGPSDATNVNVADTLPPGYTFVSATPSAGTTWTAPNWIIGNLTNNTSATLTIIATVNASGSYLNTATITGTESDPTSANNTSTVTPTPVSSADLSIVKTVDNDSPTDGDTVIFTITATNNGPSNATGVNVEDILPTGYTFVSAIPSAGTTWTAPNWNIGNLANGTNKTLTIEAIVNLSGDPENTATITGTQFDPTPANNTSTVKPVVGASTDLSIVKTASNNSPTVGTNVTFTITATNNGPSSATEVSVTDTLPIGYTLVSTNTSTGIYAGSTWTIGNLANGASETLIVVATVKAAGPYANTATISGAVTEIDPTPANNASTVTPIPVSSTDLSVVKTSSSSSPTVGTNVTFTIKATNNGPSNATGVKVTDVLPAGYTLVSATPIETTADNWNIGNLASGTSTTITIVAKVNAAGPYDNTATITGTETDPTLANNTSTVAPIIPVSSTDLSVVKTASSSSPTVGTNVTFTIKATNNGPSDATGVNVEDILPAGYTLVSATPIETTTDNWNIGNLASGASTTITIVATVNANGPYGNTATIRGAVTETDPTPGNNTSTVTPIPVSSTDLSVVKTSSSSSPTVGTNVTFTIKATNNGPSDATGVKITDILPAGYTLVSANPIATTPDNWDIGNLASGTNTTITIVAKVNATGPYDNTATITGTETDPTLANNTSTVAPIIPVSSTDLSVVKTVSNSSPRVGTNVIFTIKATNNGPSNATNVNVADALPAGYTFVSVNPSVGSYNGTTWTIGDLANGASTTLTIVATVNASGPYDNTATISGAELDPDSSPGNNTSTVTPIPVANADLEVVKTVDNSTPTVGTNVTFTITATNNGPSDATGVSVEDILPAGYTLVSANPIATTPDNWDIGNLANGASTTLTIVATVNASGSYANTATIGGIELDPTPANNVNTVTPTPVASTDLEVVKTIDNPTPTVGTNVMFTITATNNGPSDATGISVEDILPAGYTFVNATSSTGTTWISPNWNIGNLINGGTATLTIIATVNASGPYNNTATISGAESDPTATNNASTVTPTPVASTDLEVVKTIDNPTPTVGTNVMFTITATNNGPSDATGVSVEDILPAGYTLVSANPIATTPDNWDIGNLANGASTTITVVATVNASGSYANTATIRGIESDPTTTDNASTVTPTPVASADLEVFKTVDNPTPTVGTNVTFTITATNNGPSDATNVNIADTLPTGYVFVSATPSTGMWTAPNWSIGNLANGASETLTVVATVNANGPYDNTATIRGIESDPTPANNASTVTPIPVASADLEVVKTIDNAAPTVGTNVTFTITATNNGPSDATNVNIADTLPTGYVFVSATPSTGMWTAPNWSIGNLANGASETLTVIARVRAIGIYANTATISGTEQDLIPGNNSSTSTPIPGANADLEIVKTVDNTTPKVGTNVTFTIITTNHGPSDATGVTVTDSLPSGYTLVSATPSTGIWTAPNWTIGDLADGVSQTLTIVATVNASGLYANTATVTSIEPDPSTGNNTSTSTPSVIDAVVDVFAIQTPGTTTPTTVGNVTTNDTLNGVAVTTANTDVTPVTTGPLSIDSSGVLTLAPNTPSGSYSITYTICEVDPATGLAVVPANCDSATNTVVVSNPIDAVVDVLQTQTPSTTTPITVGNVTTNDTLNGIAVTTANTDVTPVTTGPLSVDAFGILTLAPNTPSGSYSITYTICEVDPATGLAVVPANCDSVTNTVIVLNPIDAVVDTFPDQIPSATAPTIIGNVTTNDTLNGMAVTTANTDVTPVTVGPLSIDASGVLTLEPNTPSGSYSITYTICEINPATGLSVVPANCDSATTTIKVLPQNISIALIKTAELLDENGDGLTQVGEKIRYNFTVTNTGAVPLINITINDPLPGVIVSGGPISLLPGESDSTSFTGIYTVTIQDLNQGSVSNQATVSGSSLRGIIVKDLSDDSSNANNEPTVLAITGCKVEVFNGVTPNDDGHNDFLYIGGLDCYPKNSVEIYNRWGVLVYSADGYNNKDISFKGFSEGRSTTKQADGLPDGTYYYVLKFTDFGGNVLSKVGYLYITR